MNLEDYQTQHLKNADKHLKQHLNSNFGFSNLEEYNSHILPPRKTLETNQHNTNVPFKGTYLISIFTFLTIYNLKCHK